MKHKGNKNLSLTQRLTIETMLKTKHSRKEICEYLGIHKSTLSREIKRGLYKHTYAKKDFWYGDKIIEVDEYSASKAQQAHEQAAENKGRDLKLGKDYALVKYIEKRVLEKFLSPCAVLGEIKRNNLPFTNISKTTLYRYIDMGLIGDVTVKKRKKKKAEKTAKRAPRGLSIEQRPSEIWERNTFGHWEMDCVCGSSLVTLLVLTERFTRKEIIFKMKDQKSQSVIHCLNVLERRFGSAFKQIFKTITVDNGSEFSNCEGMEKSIFGKKTKRTTFYYCHPYSSYERGTNERMNREIRRLIPKGSDLAEYSVEDIQRVENWINDYPREIFGYATSKELFDEQLRLII